MPQSLLRRLVGEADRVGWWTLPAFVAVGLAGAVMAGSLAAVYYSQQVSSLEAQTRQGRQDLQAAVEDVDRAGAEALEAIRSEVDAVRDSLSQTLPVEDPAAIGVVVVEARVNSPAPDSATVRPTPPADDGEADGAPNVLAQQDDQPDDASPSPSPAPTPTRPPVRPRLGLGFAVAVDDGTTFVATSFDLVRDDGARAGVVEEVRVTTLAGDAAVGEVHSWDEARGLALLRVDLGRLEVGDWRPRGEDLATGDRLVVVGTTPDGAPVHLEGTVAFADRQAVVTSLPTIEMLRGAPVVDGTGRIVAVYTPGYRPFPAAAGESPALAPVGLFCDRMLTGCESLEVEATEAPTTEQPTG